MDVNETKRLLTLLETEGCPLGHACTAPHVVEINLRFIDSHCEHNPESSMMGHALVVYLFKTYRLVRFKLSIVYKV